MLSVDAEKFMSGYTSSFGLANPGQTNGLRFLLSKAAEDDLCWPTKEQFAYGLATFKWETAHTFQPVTERGPRNHFNKYEPGTPIGRELGNTARGDGFLFRGRGYVQVTGRGNYAKNGARLSVDLVGNPDLALDPGIAYEIAARGMREGWFTGRKLNQFFPEGGAPNYTEARQIINGNDHAMEIAGLAHKFERILADAAVGFGPLTTAPEDHGSVRTV